MQNFQAGDDLVFQIESGYGLVRILAIDEAENGEKVWHLSAFDDLFLDVETAEKALENASNMTLAIPQFAITQRAFDSTQVARLGNRPLSEAEIRRVGDWRANPNAEIADRSVRLMLGLR